jgi:hypothetical protein
MSQRVEGPVLARHAIAATCVVTSSANQAETLKRGGLAWH